MMHADPAAAAAPPAAAPPAATGARFIIKVVQAAAVGVIVRPSPVAAPAAAAAPAAPCADDVERLQRRWDGSPIMLQHSHVDAPFPDAPTPHAAPEVDLARWPLFAAARWYEADVGPGDALLLPAWSPADLLERGGIATRYVTSSGRSTADSGRSVPVSGASELRAALDAAPPGDVLQY
eukprot:gene33262-5671_t